uniref:Puff-specific protein Bx42 n=1 Tax=Lygus hesperus TaxID=30085 RepID=A0A0A9WUC6_LYGHE
MDGHMQMDYKPPENFLHVAEALALAEQVGRAEIEARNRIRKSIEEKRQAEQEQKLREQALAARASLNAIRKSSQYAAVDDVNAGGTGGVKLERSGGDGTTFDTGGTADTVDSADTLEAQEAKRERLRREQLYTLRHSIHKHPRTGVKPLHERDISERIALQENIADIGDGAGAGGAVHYDERLFQMQQQ